MSGILIGIGIAGVVVAALLVVAVVRFLGYWDSMGRF